MHLLSLDIRNFRVIKRAVLPLPDSVVGVIGPNGAGKSSLVEAISWALYGNQAARSGREEIKSQFAGTDESCEVTLGFEVNGEPYRVVRRLVGRTERAEVELYRGDSSESVGVNETRQYVGQLLGLDFRGFLTSFLARQQELNALSDLQPSRRRDHLAGMLGIERLDKGISHLKEDLRLEAGQIEFMERRLAESSGLAVRIEELTTRLGRFMAREAAVTDALERAETAARQSADRFVAAQAAKAQWMQLIEKIKAERKTQSYLDEQKAQLQEEVHDLSAMQPEKDRLDETVKSLAPLRAAYEQMRETRSRILLQRQWQDQLDIHRREQQQVDTALGSCRDKLTTLTDTLKAIPADVGEQLDIAQIALDQARSDYSRLRAERDNLAHQIDKLEQQIQSVDLFGPESICDRCHRPLGEDLPKIRQHLIDELSGLNLSVEESDQRLARQSELGKKLKDRWTGLQQKVKERYQAEVTRAAVDKELMTLQARGADLAASLEKLSAQLTDSAAVVFDQAEFDRTELKLRELEDAQARLQMLRGKLTRLPVAGREVETVASKLAALDAEIETLDQRLAALDYDAAAFEKARTDLETGQQQLEKARNEKFSLDKEVEITRTELDEKLKQRDALQKEEEELEEHRTSRYHHEKLGSLLAEFRQDLIARIRPRLAGLSSRLFADMTGGKYSFVELDPKYNLRVMDGGEFFGVERFSGGEKDLANLCLRLAISQALTESAGLDRSFVILDEVFGSQDNERKELIIDALGGLKHQFPQILLITHVDDIKDRVEDLIQVSPTGNGYSEVIFNDAVVS